MLLDVAEDPCYQILSVLYHETVQDMLITPLYQQHASHTLASRAHGPQPHMRSSSATGPCIYLPYGRPATTRLRDPPRLHLPDRAQQPLFVARSGTPAHKKHPDIKHPRGFSVLILIIRRFKSPSLAGVNILPSDERARLRFWARPVSFHILLIFLQRNFPLAKFCHSFVPFALCEFFTFFSLEENQGDLNRYPGTGLAQNLKRALSSLANITN